MSPESFALLLSVDWCFFDLFKYLIFTFSDVVFEDAAVEETEELYHRHGVIDRSALYNQYVDHNIKKYTISP